MTDILKCAPCHGIGKIVGLGNMKKDCPHCLGVGYINDEEEVKEVEQPKAKRKKKEAA